MDICEECNCGYMGYQCELGKLDIQILNKNSFIYIFYKCFQKNRDKINFVLNMFNFCNINYFILINFEDYNFIFFVIVFLFCFLDKFLLIWFGKYI